MPVYSSHLLEYSDLKLGTRLREARQQQDLTLKALANRLGTSPARLSQIENERLRLSLEDVVQVATALDIAVEAIIPADIVLPYQITRYAETRCRAPQPTLFTSPAGDGVESPHQFWPLANLFVG